MSEPTGERPAEIEKLDETELELRDRLTDELTEHLQWWHDALRTSDLCLEGRVTGEESGQVTQALIRSFQVEYITNCSIVEVDLPNERITGHSLIQLGAGRLAPGEVPTLTLGKAASLTDPRASQAVPHELFFEFHAAYETGKWPPSEWDPPES